jgi:hypothetical protein
MKATFHKSCHCQSCCAGRTHEKRNANERKLRQITRQRVSRYLKGETDDVLIAPISSPFID